MSIQDILAKAKQHTSKFNTVEEWQEWQRQEQLKAAVPIEQQNRETKMRRLMNAASVPPLHQKCSFDNYNIYADEHQKHALNVAMRYAFAFQEQLDIGRCMIFSGSTGTGKNHLACAIANKVLADGYTVLVIKVSDLMSRFRQAYDRDSNITEERLSRELVAVDLLVLDEIGVSHGSKDEEIQISRLIDNRINNIKPTLVLTNLAGPELEKNLGERNFDRLLSNQGVMINFNWASYRRMQGKVA